jgi:ketosteroid isomerase-like protein
MDPAAREVWTAVQRWAAAWSARDMESYVRAYTPDFQGTSRDREAWLQQRTSRIAGRRSISIDLQEPSIKVEGDQARVHFTQHYQSDRHRSTDSRFLRMVRMDGRWLIAIESGR